MRLDLALRAQACEFDYSGTQACKALRRAALPLVTVPASALCSCAD